MPYILLFFFLPAVLVLLTAVRVGKYLNTFVFKYAFNYICVFTTVFINTLVYTYLNTVFKYFSEYLNKMYLDTQIIKM